MRRLISICIILCLGWALCGCPPRQPRTPEAVTDPGVLAAVRTEITRADPSAIVGVVSEVLPRERFAAVTDVPLEEFHVGEVVTFIDTAQRPLTHGVIRRITSEALHVQFEAPVRGARAPQVGDLAVRFKRHPPQRADAPANSPGGFSASH